jgi:hypothetical protein
VPHPTPAPALLAAADDQLRPLITQHIECRHDLSTGYAEYIFHLARRAKLIAGHHTSAELTPSVFSRPTTLEVASIIV